jgi:hypothetical protein
VQAADTAAENLALAQRLNGDVEPRLAALATTTQGLARDQASVEEDVERLSRGLVAAVAQVGCLQDVREKCRNGRLPNLRHNCWSLIPALRLCCAAGRPGFWDSETMGLESAGLQLVSCDAS